MRFIWRQPFHSTNFKKPCQILGGIVVTGSTTQLFERARCAADPKPLPNSRIPKGVCRITGQSNNVAPEVPPTPVATATVWVLDSGIDNTTGLTLGPNQIDCRPNICTTAPVGSDTRVAQDNVGHGTMIAGIIGASPNNAGKGYWGVSPTVPINVIKVVDEDPVSLMDGPLRALDYLNTTVYPTAPGGNVIVNISWGADWLSAVGDVSESNEVNVLRQAIQALAAKGIKVVIAAGNGPEGKKWGMGTDDGAC